MTQSDERAFTLLERGVVRDEIILTSFRNSLRTLINPETGQRFSEDEIQVATQQGSRWWVEADAIDLYGQTVQGRDLYLAQQWDPRTANTNWLRNVHAPLWGVTPLPAVGGSGACTAAATAGSIFVGSTTIGDPTAATARDPAGSLYQVLTTVVTPASGSADLTLKGVTLGGSTNPVAGTVMTWVANQPLGAQPTFTVAEDFSGGVDAERDADLADRIVDRIRHRPGSGNNAQVRAWARAASAAVERGYVYAAAMNAGSCLVCVTQRRGAVTGPLARIPSAGTLTDVTAYLTPPASPVVPARWHLVAVPPASLVTSLVLTLSLRRRSVGGWTDYEPWPVYSAGYSTGVAILTVTDQTHFRLETDEDLPGGATSLSGANAPQLMVWDLDSSRWERLNVQSVTDAGSNHFDVVLNVAPDHLLAIGDRVSPHTGRLDAIAEAVESYFDSLGPGEVINLLTDPRSDRAFRYPEPIEEFPARIGQTISTHLTETLGAALTDVALEYSDFTEPSLPTSVVDGPRMLTLGRLAIYELI